MTPLSSFNIAESDFAAVRSKGYRFVDKSFFIEQVLTGPAKVLLLPRPRRFGKTLNLSMLRYFLEKPKEKNDLTQEERRNLFAGLEIEKSDKLWTHFGKYPVMFLTFKDVKTNSWTDAFVAISKLLSNLYEEHDYLLQSSQLSPQGERQFRQILNREASPAESLDALEKLSQYLYAYHGEQVVILMDEYDTPLHDAYLYDYYEEAILFFRNLLSGVLKDNRYLFKGVLTGVLRVAKESMFSGINNVGIYSFLRPEFATSFGFTKEEVHTLTKQLGHTKLLPDIKSWYNGYLFGKKYEIYNPWSIVKFLTSTDHELQAYWVNTGSNDLIEKQLFDSGFSTQKELETLLQGGEIDKPLEEDLILRDLNADSIWSFLLFSGYLKATKQYSKNDLPYVKLALPNREVKSDFTKFTRSWLQTKLGRFRTLDSLIEAIFAGNAEKIEEVLCHLMKVSMSYHDVKSEKAQRKKTEKSEEKTYPEAVYHAFILGLLISVQDDYHVRSNPETGYGRADMMLLPKYKGKPGVIMEFKILKKNQNPEEALQDAWQQIKQKHYRTELQEHKANPIIEYAIVFSGKQAFIQSEPGHFEK